MEFQTNAVSQDLTHSYDVIRAFFERRNIRAIDPDDQSLALERHWIDGRCVIFGHDFRNPKSNMIQWMRVNVSLSALIDETCDLIKLLIGQQSIRRITYFEAFQTYTGVDPFTDQDCSEAAIRLGLDLNEDCEKWNRNTWLHFLFTHAIQPHLGQGELTVILDFIPSLFPEDRVIEKEKDLVAEHFEIYFAGIELATGFGKSKRKARDPEKEFPALDEEFLTTLNIAIPILAKHEVLREIQL